MPAGGRARLAFKASEPAASPYAAERAARLAADFARLAPEQQVVVEELVAVLLKKRKTPKAPCGG
ncbi:MAG TPA: hypothetical protein VGF26_21080 [Ramlibacter sp.]